MGFLSNSLSPSQTSWTVAGAALLVHLIFKQTETTRLYWLFILLLGIPAYLTLLYLPHAGSIILAAAKVFSLFWSTLVASILVYRVSPWHPLAKYPGPFLCKLTKFHLAYFALCGKQYLYYYELHQKYGIVVRIGPNELSIRDVESIAPLMGSNGFQRGPFWSGRVPKAERVTIVDNGAEQRHEVVSSLIGIVDKQEHSRRKRPWSKGFSTSALKDYEILVIKRILQFMEVLSSKNLKEAINLTTWITYFGYDVMNDVAFGGGSELMRDGDVIELLPRLERAQKLGIFMSHVPWLGAMIVSRLWLFPEFRKIRRYLQERALHRIKEGSRTKDLFHHLLNEGDVGTYKPSVSEVISDSDLAIIAGSDTTSNAITNVLYYLMTNPTAYKRLQAEIDELGDSVVDCSTQVHLPYLNAVLHESLRLLPPVLSGVQRASEKGTGGRMAGSIFIPEGSSAFVHTYSLQRDPRYFFPLPDSFLPERWLSQEQRQALEPKIFHSQEKYIHNTDAFIPFSVGPTNCAGKNLAWLEMRMAVSVIISRFDLKLDPSYNPRKWYEDMGDYFVMIKGPLPTLLSPRQSVKV